MSNDATPPQRFFHPGEVKIQAEAGSDTDHYEAMSAHMMIPDLKENEVRFVEDRTFSVVASIDAETRPWASVLFATDEAPLFTVETPTVVRINTPLDSGDPLLDNIDATGELGVLYFDPSKRRRSKSMGHATAGEDRTIRYEMTRNFGLCPKYIYKRDHQPAAISVDAAPPSSARPAQPTTVLSVEDQQQLRATDTLFLASFYPEHGTDATHRGGEPGFVDVLSPNRIEIPDYVGNGMFNTIGNLVLDPRLGLTTLDFTTGRTLQLTGRATVRRNDRADIAAERMLTLDIEQVVVTTAAVGTWTDVEASPYNPPVPGPVSAS